MDRYHVIMSSQALRDLYSIFDHIAVSLQEPNVASQLIDRIESAIETLDHMPFRCPVREIGIYANGGYRQLLAKNYTVVFRINEEEKSVMVITIRYSASNF